MEIVIGIITALNVAFTIGWNIYKDKKRVPPTEIRDQRSQEQHRQVIHEH